MILYIKSKKRSILSAISTIAITIGRALDHGISRCVHTYAHTSYAMHHPAVTGVIKDAREKTHNPSASPTRRVATSAQLVFGIPGVPGAGVSPVE